METEVQIQNDSRLRDVLSEFRGIPAVHSVASLGNNGGFSGASIWRIESEAGPLCLRAWPIGSVDHRRIRMIHSLIEFVAGTGLSFVPIPKLTHRGHSFVRYHGQFYELTPWMPGEATFHSNPTPARLKAAMCGLGHFHNAARQLAGAHLSGPSPTLKKRMTELRFFWKGTASEELRRRVLAGSWPEMDIRARQFLELADCHSEVFDELLMMRLPNVVHQTVIRDVWHDHLLFEGDRLTGLIDFGAVAQDCVSIDLVRLLGSLVGDDQAAWRSGLAAYQEVAPWPDDAHAWKLLRLMDQSGVLAGGLVWLRAHYLENRPFAHREDVLARVDHFLGRLQQLDSWQSSIHADLRIHLPSEPVSHPTVA